jgi:hypothetical protein
MRRTFVLLVCFVVIGNWAFGVEICDYLPPESRYASLDISLGYRFFDDQFADDRYNVNTGDLGVDFTSLFDSVSYGYNLGVDAKASYTKDGITYGAIGSGNYQMYLAEGDLFGFGGITLRASTLYKAIGVNVVSGSGYGRFRDVTPLAKTMKIEDMLLDMGSLTQPLPDETLQAVAVEIGRRIEYPDIKELVKKVAEIIEATGLVVEAKLGAVELLRIEEIILQIGDSRLCGWDVRGGLGYEVVDPWHGERDFITFAAFNYALPPNPWSQFLVKLDFSSSFEIFDNYSLSGLATYTHRLSPDTDLNLSYSFLRNKPPEQQPLDSHTFNVGVVLGGDINLAAGLSLKLETGYDEWAKELRITVNYTVF